MSVIQTNIEDARLDLAVLEARKRLRDLQRQLEHNRYIDSPQSTTTSTPFASVSRHNKVYVVNRPVPTSQTFITTQPPPTPHGLPNPDCYMCSNGVAYSYDGIYAHCMECFGSFYPNDCPKGCTIEARCRKYR
jgi:hypothetical protein